MEVKRLNNLYKYNERKKSAIVLLSISLALFLGFLGFFVWHTATIRNYELNFIKTDGVVVNVEKREGNVSHNSTSTKKAYYHLVIAYTFEDKEYTFTDRIGYQYAVYDKIGTSLKVYVNTKNPSQTELVTSADYISIISTCFFAFFCVAYACGMNVLLSIKGNTIKKRLLYVWGVEIILGIATLLLFWLGLPHSGFNEVFVYIKGAIGISVILGLVLCTILLDVIITQKLRLKVTL